MSAGNSAKQAHQITRHPAVADIRDLLMFRIAMISAAGDRVAQGWLADEFDLRIMEWRAIGVIKAMQPVRFFELAKALLIDKGQLSRLISALTQRGFVASAADPQDQRTMRLRLTTSGTVLHDRVLARALERNERVTGALEPGELETLFALLDKLQPFMTHRAEPDGDGETGR